jgi:two-component system, NarL family, response regulator YdfI
MAKKNGSGTIRVLVGGGSAVRRAGLEAIVHGMPRLKLVGIVPMLSGISAQARALQPDVILADLDRADPLFIAGISPAVAGGISVITLIDAPTAAWAAHALRTGIRAILPRDAPSEEIVSAIQGVHSGLVLMDTAVMQGLARHVHVEDADSAPEAFDELPPREIEILRMLAEGLGNKQIALQLGISEHTVKFHISSILDKLGASSRTEAVTSGIRMGLILL